MLADEVMHVVTNSAQQKADLEAYMDGNDDDDGSDLDDDQYDEAVANASSPHPRMGVRAVDTGEVAPVRSIELTPEGKIKYDDGEPMAFDGRDDYTSGMERMITSGVLTTNVMKKVVPYLVDPDRLRPDDRTVEFFSNPALDVWYASTFVCAKHQLFMHPSFGAKSRLFWLNNGFLAIGDLWSDEIRQREHPGLKPGQLCIGGGLMEIRGWVNEANRNGKQEGKKPIEWVIHVSIVEDLLELLGYRHYDPDADAKDFLVLMDAEYPDGSADFLLMKAEKGVGTPDDPHHVVVGCICGYASFGVVAVPVKAPTLAQDHKSIRKGTCPIQAVRFLATGARGSNSGSGLSSEVFVERTLFFRAGSRDGTKEGLPRDPVMIPYMLCHGRVYERLGRTGEFQTHELEVEHGFTRLCVYYMYDGFWDDPRWKFAPPQAVLAAGGFRVQLPLVGSRINGERLRGIMLVLNPREGHMADTYLLSMIKSSTSSRSVTSVFQLPSETQDLALTAPKSFDVRVWQATAYHETVGQLQPTLDDQYRPSLPQLTSRQLEASFRLGKVAKFPNDNPPGSFLTSTQTQEVYYRQGRTTPMIVKTGFRYNTSQAGELSAAEADAANAKAIAAMSKQLEAVALARQRQAEADEQAALALEQAQQQAAAKARLDKKARKKKEREDYLAKNAKDAPGPSSGTPSQEVIEANRIAREERLLALATAERKQKEADAEAEKEAQRAAKAAQQAEQPQLTRQQQVLLNQAAAREKKRLEKEAKAKGGARGQQLPPPPQANVEDAVRRAQLEAMQPAPPRANQRRNR